jgi:extradiol dioxygenase family protein
MTADRPPFHLAFPVDDLAAARAFYGGLLGCPEGRSSPEWVDFDLRGHQIVAHLDRTSGDAGATNAVDGEQVPVRHFGLVLEWSEWEALAERLRAAGIEFLIAPGIRFAGEVGEQATLFVRDPAGNALEFKAFRDPSRLFAR